LFDSGFVAIFHRGFATEFHATLVIDPDAFDPNRVAHFHNVFDFIDAEIGQLRNVNKAVFAWQDFDECAEFLDRNDCALIDLANRNLLGHAIDDFLGALEAFTVVRVDVDGSVVLDVDLSASLGNDAFDRFAAWSNDEADLVWIDPDGFDTRGVLAKLSARAGKNAVHDIQDFCARLFGLDHRLSHDLVRDAGQFEIQLETGDADVRSTEFEIHVTEVIFAADNVGKRGVAFECLTLEFGNETDRDTDTGRRSGTPASMSEVMESNGSTSMASVCAGVLALMDAGVPLRRPVAGISVGLVTEFEGETLKRYTTLTDIIGSEDHFGDMDFKLCGTDVGVTGFQLDLKLPGISHEIMAEAVIEAKESRTKILDVMNGILASPRAELSQYAPRIETIRINPDKIGLIIGPGGKTIKGIVAETGAEINIEDDGSIHIYSNNGESLKRAKEIINGMTKEISIGEIYQGTVVSIKEFGAFVEVLPGKDGLVHISELADFRVNKVEDVVKMGDAIWVKCIGVDDKGRVKLSRKAAMKDRDEAAVKQD